jgi:thioredoxin reductase (NADPH)
MESLAADLAAMRRTPLRDAHVAALRAVAREAVFEAGAMVAEPGQPMDSFLYVLDGEIELLDPRTRERRVPATLGPGQFAGEIALLTGGAHALPMRAVRRTRALVAPREALLRLMARIPEMSDIVVTVLAARRRRMLEQSDGGLTIVGAERSRGLRRIVAFAGRNRIPVQTLELGSPEAEAAARTCGAEPGAPLVIFGGDRVVKDPSPGRVAELLGLQIALTDTAPVDVLIVGGGPAGVAAAVYAGAEGLSALTLDEMAVGGQAGTSSRIENYMGFPTGISGADLVWRGWVQAMKFGARFAVPKRVAALSRRDDGLFCATLNDGREVCARAVVVATGVQYRRLPIARLEDFEGAGVYYAATDTEARYCRDGEVAIVGGGNSAGQAAMHLSRAARHVHVLVRGDSLAASMSDYLVTRLENDPAITIHFGVEVAALHGGETLEAITVRDRATGGERRMSCCGVFVMAGAAPNTGWLSGVVALDDKGFVPTGAAAGGSSTYATSQPGIFAVGDVRAGSTKRVASAVGEGSVVISSVWRHVREPDGTR